MGYLIPYDFIWDAIYLIIVISGFLDFREQANN